MPKTLNSQEIKKITNGIFEIFDLTRTPRTGWLKIGIRNPENVAEHIMLTAQIGFILAVLEGEDPEKVACICLFHDNTETRTGDLNKLNKKYFDKSVPELVALKDFANNFSSKISIKIKAYFNEFQLKHNRESIIARDADMLQMIFQAKYYLDIGYQAAKSFINNTEKKLETESARLICKEVKKTNFTDWLGEDYKN